MPLPPRTSEPQTCDCPTRRHRHGTEAMYKYHRCGCRDCRDRIAADRRRRAHQAEPDTVPVAQALEVLDAYLLAGYTIRQVGEVSGLDHRHIASFRRRTRVHRTTYETILGAGRRLRDPEATKMDATGTARRIRALTATGWSIPGIATEAGVNRTMVSHIRTGRKTRCSASTAARVRAAYDRLWDQAPPAGTVAEKRAYTQAVGIATREGWLPPMAWDDDRIDDPAYTPNVTQLRRGRFDTSADRLDDMVHLIDCGTPAEEAAHRAGYPSTNAAYEAAKYRGLPRIAALFTKEAAA